jgi:uncharacterized membrane protein
VAQDPGGQGRDPPSPGALLVVAATLAVGPFGAVALAAALDRVAVAGVPVGVLGGELVAPAAFAVLVAGYALTTNALERRRGPGRG